jgi:leucyl/phenylalanyl-tRNA---protein transferase
MRHPRLAVPHLEIVVHETPPPAPLPPCAVRFPDPRRADAEGLLAWGGDLEPSTIVEAYRRGIFPWPQDADALLWWSPDPRSVLPLDGFRVSHRLARTLRRNRFRLTIDAAFARVIDGCAARDETWITPAMRAAYVRLHALGWAHSVEAWTADGALAGGLYGVAVGGLFAAESMFHRVTDASKVALAALVQHAAVTGVALLDVQVSSAHLRSMGARDLSRARYLAALADAVRRPVTFTPPPRIERAAPSSKPV